MNSCLYRARVMHHRLEPKKHRFHYDVFMFYLDLDEIASLTGRLRLMSRNAFNLFSFKDSEHLQLPRENPDRTKDIKSHIHTYLSENGIEIPAKIMLLTNLSVLGYNFNPVSFYFCFRSDGSQLCAIAEVGNTFGEQKPFLLTANTLRENTFRKRVIKYFYVSPFFNHDTCFDFNLETPGESLNIRIDDFEAEKRVFISTLTGKKAQLTDKNLLLFFFSFPFLTLRIISLIHWHALKLWIKKIPFRRKGEHVEMQKEVFRPYFPEEVPK
jgi:DUF1365 family protein